MRVERYQEVDMRKAMAKVRADLGSDAVIISSRRVAGKTEIMAAIDYDPSQLEAEMLKFTIKKPAPRKPVTTNKVRTDRVWEIIDAESTPVSTDQPSLLDMQEELEKLRKLFEGELAQLAWREEGRRQPNRLALVSRLEITGISRDIATRVVDKILPCSDLELGWRKVLRMLSRIIKPSPHDVLANGGVIALLGSTGVGKTTTAAKIAGQFAKRHGKNKVAFITTDNSRIGGQEQLISLGSSLGIPVQIATTQEEMRNTLESLSERMLVIIDTAGISHKDKALKDKYRILNIENVDIHPFLLLSATSQESVINETIKAYSNIELTAAIITKTDESAAIGPTLSGLIRNKLAVSFLGNGQKIPQDLHPANPEKFINNILDSYSDYINIESLKSMRVKSKKAVHV